MFEEAHEALATKTELQQNKGGCHFIKKYCTSLPAGIIIGCNKCKTIGLTVQDRQLKD